MDPEKIIDLIHRVGELEEVAHVMTSRASGPP
jgi:hypothetical protein